MHSARDERLGLPAAAIQTSVERPRIRCVDRGPPGGQSPRGNRAGGEPIEGQADCAKRHPRSGSGVEDGRIVIPLITGKYLIRKGSPDLARIAHPGRQGGGLYESVAGSTTTRSASTSRSRAPTVSAADAVRNYMALGFVEPAVGSLKTIYVKFRTRHRLEGRVRAPIYLGMSS